MARTSRYAQTQTPEKYKKWKAALYIRLSREDGDKEESDSIANQRNFLRNYAEQDPELEIVDAYVDDGFTGTNFERPDFNRMMENIRAKAVNCVIVKDLSRFGRNYIEVGKYIEQIFPFMDVRFISVNDMLDSYKNPQAMNNLIVPFKNIINDEYCRDISSKVRSTLDRKRKDGKFIGSFACYGYQKDPADKNQLMIDEDAADVVRQIFQWHLDGISVIGITRKLNEMGICNPSSYKKRQGMNYQHPAGKQNDTLWHDRTVRRILHSQMYIGNLVQGVNQVKSYKVQKATAVPQEDWIVVENTHEPIVSRDLFDKVQDLLQRDTRTAPQTSRVYLFSGFLKCADCGKAMIKKNIVQPYGEYVYYYCATYKKMAKGACTKHTIRESELEQAVLSSICKQVELAVSMEEVIERLNHSAAIQCHSNRFTRLLTEQEQEFERLMRFKQSLYEDWKSGDITHEEYRDMKYDYEKRIEHLRESIVRLTKQQNEAQQGVTDENAFLQSFKKYRNITKLTRDILVELIDNILVHEGKKITIQFKFADEYQKALDFIESNEQLYQKSGHEKTA